MATKGSKVLAVRIVTDLQPDHTKYGVDPHPIARFFLHPLQYQNNLCNLSSAIGLKSSHRLEQVRQMLSGSLNQTAYMELCHEQCANHAVSLDVSANWGR